MARLLSTVASVIRGSVGGLTYTANQFHAIIMRARVSPVNPMTYYQTALRSAFSWAESIWKGLSEAEKRAWDQFADTVTMEGPLGSYTVPGRTLADGWLGFRRYLYENTFTFGAIVNTSPVTPGRILAPSLYSVAQPASGEGFVITMQNLNTVAVNISCQISRAFTDSRNTFKGPFNHVEFLAARKGVNVAASATATFTFEDLTVGNVYFLRFVCVTYLGAANVSIPMIIRVTALSSANGFHATVAPDGGPGLSGAAPLTTKKHRKVL